MGFGYDAMQKLPKKKAQQWGQQKQHQEQQIKRGNMVSMASKPILKGREHSRTSLCHKRLKTKQNKKVELFIGKGTISWSVMVST